MEKFLTVAKVIVPIFFTVFMGILARKRGTLSSAEVHGMQRFAVKFCCPCLIFRSCLTASIGAEALGSMALLPPFLLVCTFWSFWMRKEKMPYHNLPYLFCCKETGLMGLPLFIILFGADQVYRMGVLDIAQAVTGYSVLAILSADTGSDASVKGIVKEMLKSPLIILSVLGLILNLSGIWGWLSSVGIGGIVEESLGFISQPVSAVMLFCVGYNFSLDRESRADVMRICVLHTSIFAVIGIAIQGLLFFVPGVDALTRWAMALFCALPTSYLAPGLGRKEQDCVVASGVCSIQTLVCLAVFCVMAVFVA